MLQEVSQTALVVLFQNRTHFLGYVEVGLSAGSFIVADVVGQPVVKHSCHQGGILGQLGHLGSFLGEKRAESCGDAAYQPAEEAFFHNACIWC